MTSTLLCPCPSWHLIIILAVRLQKVNSNEITVSCSDTSEEEEEDSEESNESNTESDHLEASQESLSSSDEVTIRSKRQKEKMRRKRRRKEVLCREKAREIVVKQENEKREAKLKVRRLTSCLTHLTPVVRSCWRESPNCPS